MSSGVVVWFTGLPSSGKSRLAGAVRQRLRERSEAVCVLDGDRVRELLVPAHDYSVEGRGAFYATLARLSAELAHQGLIVLVPATAHLRHYRRLARDLAPRFVEVWLSTPLEECRRRDAKGLYAAGLDELAMQLPGAGLVYEPPEHAEVEATGGEDEAAVGRIVALIDEQM